MVKINASLSLYFIVSLLYLFSIIIDNENLSLITKPIIIPSIVFFYFLETKKNVNYWFVMSLFLFFIGDMLYLINDKEFFELGLFVFLMPYLIVLAFIFEDFKLLDKKRLITQLNLSFLIVFFALLYIAISLLNVLSEGFNEDFLYFVFFGIELFFMGIFTALLYLAQGKSRNFFLMFAVISFIISDIFFVINKAIYGLLVLNVVCVFSQTISYFFYVKYMLERTLLDKSKAT